MTAAEEMFAIFRARGSGAYFGERVSVSEHALQTAYFAKLSEASVATLKLQGGPMSAAKAARFEGERFHQEAVRLRRWDDQGKVAGLTTTEFEHYRTMIDRLTIRN
jgi:predicted HD phosphohydrolase